MERRERAERPAKEPEGMDASVREHKIGTPKPNNARPCWAIKQLIKEVLELFPETTYEVAMFNERNVGLEVWFVGVEEGLKDLLLMTDADHRVEKAYEDGDHVMIRFRNSARTQDLRDPFGLAEAWEILEEDDDQS